jgi:outer membrane protein OmpA-like peptidoglycan-associated protein
MSTFGKILLVVLGVHLLWGGALYFRRAPIEQDLTDRVRESLSRSEFSDVRVEFSGRIGILSGSVDYPEIVAEAERLARRPWGVRTIENRIQATADQSHRVASKAMPGIGVSASGTAGNSGKSAVVRGLQINGKFTLKKQLLQEFEPYRPVEKITETQMPVQHISYQNNSTAADPTDFDLEFRRLEINKLLEYFVINFDTSSSALTVKSRQALDQVGKILSCYPDINIEIQGHTDSTGTPGFNKLLSSARSRAVYNYLVDTGTAAERLRLNAYGSMRSAASNRTLEGRRLNRRVVLQALQQ